MDLFGEPTEPEEEIIETDLSEPATPPAEAFTHPRAMNFCLGHEAVEHQLLEHYKSGRMPHGLIFAGPKGIGKATMAYRLAKFLFHHGLQAEPSPETLEVEPNAQAARLVVSGGHPDLMSVERQYDATKNTFKDSVEVSEIRKVTPFLHMTASYGGWRVVIVDDADTMNRSAQNALLKILEEPPANTILILVTHRLGALVPTIRSRTQLINFQPLTANVLSGLLERSEHRVPLGEQALLSALAQGSFGQALRYIEEDGLPMLQTVTGLLERYPHWNWPEIHTLADNLGRAGQNRAYDMFSELMPWTLSRLVLAKAKGCGIPANDVLDKPALQTLLKNSSLEQLLKICDNLQEHFARVKYANLDKKQGVLQAFTLIAA